MALGVDGMSLATTVAGACVGYQPTCFAVLYSVGQLGGQTLLVCGLALIPMAGLATGTRRYYDEAFRRRYAKKLRPLWRTLSVEFPHIRLSENPDGGGFDDLVQEISDALAELSRFSSPAHGDTNDPEVAANMIASALYAKRRRKAVEEPEPVPPYPRIEPCLDDWRARAQWMVSINRKLRGTVAMSEQGGSFDVPGRWNPSFSA
jgi:hypothetical protein